MCLKAGRSLDEAEAMNTLIPLLDYIQLHMFTKYIIWQKWWICKCEALQYTCNRNSNKIQRGRGAWTLLHCRGRKIRFFFHSCKIKSGSGLVMRLVIKFLLPSYLVAHHVPESWEEPGWGWGYEHPNTTTWLYTTSHVYKIYNLTKMVNLQMWSFAVHMQQKQQQDYLMNLHSDFQ